MHFVKIHTLDVRTGEVDPKPVYLNLDHVSAIGSVDSQGLHPAHGRIYTVGEEEGYWTVSQEQLEEPVKILGC